MTMPQVSSRPGMSNVSLGTCSVASEVLGTTGMAGTWSCTLFGHSAPKITVASELCKLRVHPSLGAGERNDRFAWLSPQ